MTFDATIPLAKRLAGIALGDSRDHEPAPPAPPEPVPTAAEREDVELLERLLTNFEDLTHELHAQQRQRLAEMQRVAIEVAVAVASRLVHERLDAGDVAVEGLVRQVAARLEPKETLTIYLHPADLTLLEQRAKDCQRLLPGAGHLKLMPDAALRRGDCRAETGDMSLLLQVDKQLEEMRKHLMDTLPDAEIEQRRAQPGDRQLRRFPDRRHIA